MSPRGEKLNEQMRAEAMSNEPSLYYLIMVQAITQGSGIPGLMEYIMEHSAHINELPQLIIQAQKSGEAAQGDPEVMSSMYIALFQGYTLLLMHDDELKKKITPEIFTNVLRNTRKPE